MKITVVGSSHGVPEANRQCACMMIEVGENVYFVDMGSSGMGALRKRGIPVENVRGIFITHMHGDHINGLVEFVDLITWYFRKAKPVICLPKPEAAKIIEQWTGLIPSKRETDIEYRKTEPGCVYDDGTLKVTAFATKHCPLSHSYLVEAEGKRVLFTGDLNRPGVDFPQVEGKIDLLICESAHFPATEYLPVLENMDVAKVCVTHFSDTFLESVLQFIRAMAEKGVPARYASDDLEILV